jgi:hypothetical protein
VNAAEKGKELKKIPGSQLVSLLMILGKTKKK